MLLYPAATSVDKTRFHMINKETGNRLKQQMIDAETGDVVESDQKGRGYELKKGEYVEIDKDELEPSRSRATTPSISTALSPKRKSTSAFLTTPITSLPTARPARTPLR